MESFELASLALQRPNGTAYIKGLLDEDKIEGSERLGDLIRQFDRDLALKVYARGNASEKVRFICFISLVMQFLSMFIQM